MLVSLFARNSLIYLSNHLSQVSATRLGTGGVHLRSMAHLHQPNQEYQILRILYIEQKRWPAHTSTQYSSTKKAWPWHDSAFLIKMHINARFWVQDLVKCTQKDSSHQFQIPFTRVLTGTWALSNSHLAAVGILTGQIFYGKRKYDTWILILVFQLQNWDFQTSKIW